MHSLTNQTVLITGASSGIGQACAQLFAQHGANLLLCARREERLVNLAKALTETYNVAVHYTLLDVRHAEQVEQWYQNLPASWQKIDVLINNAGLAAGLDPLHEGSVTDWEAMIDTNLKGLLYLTRTILPSMVARNQGHIINIGSIAGHDVYQKGNVYCATKHAVRALSKGLRMDLHGTLIRVTEVDPGMVETEFSEVRFHGDSERAQKLYQGFTPLTGTDVADTILYAVTRPAHVNISEILLTATAQSSATEVYKTNIVSPVETPSQH